MDSVKLSIVLPVYNVEKYINKCLISIVKQNCISHDEYEVIIVNDGSPDGSIDIINNFDWERCRHVIITQDNKGLSSARNTGLKCAKGQYVWFVDSDDYLSNTAVSQIINALDGCNMINFGYIEERSGMMGKYFMPSKSYCGRECLVNGFFQPAQFHVYKKSFLDDNNLTFMEGIYHEDAEFTPKALYLAGRIINIKECLYYYQIHEGSIMTTVSIKRAFDYLKVAQSLIEFSIKKGETLKSTPLLETICLVINNSLSIAIHASSEEKKMWNKLFGNNKKFIEAMIHSCSFKYKLEGLIIKCFHLSPINVYKFLIKLK